MREVWESALGCGGGEKRWECGKISVLGCGGK